MLANGDALLGLHFYTWATIVFIAIILGGAVMLLVRQPVHLRASRAGLEKAGAGRRAHRAAAGTGNGVSTVLECAGGLCPDNPTNYMLLQDGALKSLFRPIGRPSLCTTVMPDLIRASTRHRRVYQRRAVDGRVKPGHDGGEGRRDNEACATIHHRHARTGSGIHGAPPAHLRRAVDGQVKPGHDGRTRGPKDQ